MKTVHLALLLGAPTVMGALVVTAAVAEESSPTPAKGVGAAPAAPAAQPAAPTAPGPELSPEDAARRKLAAASFKGGAITIGALEDNIAGQNPFMRRRFLTTEAREKLLRKMTRFELLALEAQRRGYGDNPEVQHAVKQNAVQTYIRTEFDDKITAESIADEEIAAYYTEHEDEFVQPPMRRVSHVQLATREEADALLTTAKDMDLRAFRQLAREKSTDERTKLRGGDLRFFDAEGTPRGKGQPTVEAPVVKAAFALGEVGDTQPEVLAVKGGFSIVKLTGIRPPSERSREEADQTIRMRLWRAKRQQTLDDHVAALKAADKPQIDGRLVTLIKFDEPQDSSKGKGLPDGFPHKRPHDGHSH